MRRLLCLLLVLFALPAFAQYPEVSAAVEALMAKDLSVLSKHLPPGLEKGLADLPAAEQRELSAELLPFRLIAREGGVIKRSDGTDAVVVIEAIEPKPGSPTSVTIALAKRISDGSECLLQFTLNAGEGRSGEFQVWMRFVDGEWRVYELQGPDYGRKVNLDAPDFLARMRHTDINSNEAAAIGSMRSYNTASFTYTSSYPDIGYPSSAEEFGTPEGRNDIDEHHSGLIDEKLAKPPFVKSGYRFTYKRLGEAGYTVIGRPIQFGVTGNRSFFSDQTGVIRSTDKDEEPTEHDVPVR